MMMLSIAEALGQQQDADERHNDNKRNSTLHPQKLSEAEKRTLQRLLNVLEKFRDLHPTMTVHQLSIFLRVALNEGQSVNDYGRQSGVAQSVISRHLLDLSTTMRSKDTGLGLLDAKTDVDNLRRHLYALSRKGEALAHETNRLLTGTK